MFFSFGGDDDDDHDGPHGMPGGMGMGGGDVDNESYYKLLGLEKGASTTDIKKAYRNMAKLHHPDKGGDENKFKEISKAYEVLSDDEKRAVYDKYGEAGVNGDMGGHSHGGPDDLLDILMGRGRRGPGPSGKPQKRRGEDVVFPLKIGLEDVYTGTSKKLRLTKNVICVECSGKGGLGDSVQQCKGCKGQGYRMVIRQVGPGMIQQMQTHCPDCNGEGTIISEKDRCTKCKGARTLKEKKQLEVFIQRGMQHGQKVVFKGEADEAPDTVPGDVVVVLQVKEHPIFTRRGPNLFMKKTISLAECLCGFEFPITHLDGRVLLVKSDPGKVYNPKDTKSIHNEGMPMEKNPYSKGNLYIEFDVEFPKSGQLAENTCKLLKKILPASEQKDETPIPPEHDECHLIDVDLQAEKRRIHEESREAYDDDDEHHHAGPGCRQA